MCTVPFYVQLTLQDLKFKLSLKFLFISNCIFLFNMSIAQHISAYLAIIRRIKVIKEIAQISHAVTTRLHMFS
jgi:hypothetical protein